LPEDPQDGILTPSRKSIAIESSMMGIHNGTIVTAETSDKTSASSANMLEALRIDILRAVLSKNSTSSPNGIG